MPDYDYYECLLSTDNNVACATDIPVTNFVFLPTTSVVQAEQSVGPLCVCKTLLNEMISDLDIRQAGLS